jgi:hypothetical protein
MLVRLAAYIRKLNDMIHIAMSIHFVKIFDLVLAQLAHLLHSAFFLHM